MRLRKLVPAVLLLAFVVVPTSANATTFGANLNREANNPYTCSQFLFYGGPTTCSAESIDPTTGESSFPPAGEGIVSVVRVKVGPTTGPMQIVEEEALRADNPADPGHPTYACCKAIALSQVFTPTANAITTVPVNFHVKQDLAPEASGYYVDQHLSLSVLDPNVPIPASTDPNAGVGLWFPAWKLGEERAGSYGTSGATILFNADWEPAAAGGGGSGGGGGAGSGKAPLTLANQVARVRGGNALLELLCNQAVPCTGQALLQNREAGLARLGIFGRAKTKAIIYASAAFKIPAGKKSTVKAPLKGAGKRLLKHRGKVKVWLNVSLKGSSSAVPSVKITLKK
ncbi:MAG: hypothetical protein WBM00_06250 [Solirubrobacterales bacterium]